MSDLDGSVVAPSVVIPPAATPTTPLEATAATPTQVKKKASRSKKNSDAPKGKVGRPPKPKIGPPIPKEGVVTAPLEPENIVELSYYDPTMFKMLFGYYKRAEAGEIHMDFTATGLTILAADHGKNSISRAEISGAEMNTYFCSEPITICVSHILMNNVFKTVTKAYSRVALSIRRQSQKSKLYLAFEDRENAAHEIFEVSTIDPKERPIIVDESDTYPLCFSMYAKRFRETVKGAKQFGGIIKIERTDGSLHIISDDNNTAGVAKSCIFDQKKKMIRDTLGSDIISASLDVDVIKSFAEINVAGEIIVSVDNFRDLKIELILAYNVVRVDGAGATPAPAPAGVSVPVCKLVAFFKLKKVPY